MIDLSKLDKKHKIDELYERYEQANYENKILSDIIRVLLNRVGGEIKILKQEMLENEEVAFELSNNKEDDFIIIKNQ